MVESGLWRKVKKYARIAGAEVVEKSLLLWYAARKPETPRWAKRVILGSLGYFISPLDFIPDLTPVLGYTDDLAALALALATVSAYVDEDVRRAARAKMERWFA